MSERYRHTLFSDLLVKAVLILFTFHLSLFVSSCGGGDDDGLRLGDIIVGTWQRGYGVGDVVIEGDTNLSPEDLTYDKFLFSGDGAYNGMVRDGRFSILDDLGAVVFEGDYRCDNHNMKFLFMDEEGRQQSILAQVLYFNGDTVQLSWEYEGVIFKIIIRKSI